MQILPAIDLKDHKVVRLSQGKMGTAKIYSEDILLVSKRWVDAGATRLHLVDLNGAFEGKPVHFDEVKKLLHSFPSVQFEIGGGIRSIETIKKYFQTGVHFCILGTVALKNPELLKEAVSLFPSKIILGVDAKAGMVATEGWDEVSQLKATSLAKKCESLSLESIIFTDVAKDGMMQGMSLESIAEMAQASAIPIIASGGFTSLEDIKALKKIKNVKGVIAGKALYEGLVDLKEAIA